MDCRQVAVKRIGVVPYSLAYGRDRLFDTSCTLNRDHSLRVWHEFREDGAHLGWDVRTADSDAGGFHAYLVLDPSPGKIRTLRRDLLRRAVVQFFEPPSVCPEQYEPEHLDLLASHCRVVYCCNHGVCSTHGFRERPWYVDLYPSRQERVLPARDRRGICLIATNRFSRHPESQLDLRLSLARTIAEDPEFRTQFDLYGTGWLTGTGLLRKHLPRSAGGRRTLMDKILLRLERRIPGNGVLGSVYRGPVRAKADVLSTARFNLIVENMFWDGYVTEKLFDALQFGGIPIYFGASDVEDAVPAGVFLNGRRFSEPMDAIRSALSLSERELDRMILAGQDWLHSADFQSRFGRRAYIETLLKDISEVVSE